MIAEEKLDKQIEEMRAAIINAACIHRGYRPLQDRVIELINAKLSDEAIFRTIAREQPIYIKVALTVKEICKPIPISCFIIIIVIFTAFQNL